MCVGGGGGGCFQEVLFIHLVCKVTTFSQVWKKLRLCGKILGDTATLLQHYLKKLLNEPFPSTQASTLLVVKLLILFYLVGQNSDAVTFRRQKLGAS